MVVEKFVARLLSPLTYHSFPESGASGATTTAPWLGDIALNYAIHYAVHGHPIPLRIGVHDPDYEEDIKKINTRCTMGMASGTVEYMSVETKASSFVSEGFEQRRISSLAPSKPPKGMVRPIANNTPWRAWRQVQALAPGNTFEFFAVSKKSLPKRFTVRMGLSRGTLIEMIKRNDMDGYASVNKYTVEKLLRRSMNSITFSSVETPLFQYQIYHGIKPDVLEHLLGWEH